MALGDDMSDQPCVPSNLIGPDGRVHLTALAKAGGCGSKRAPDALARITRHLRDTFREADYADLLVGLDVSDDAAVWRVSDDRSLIFTVDFFAPIVDDPYDYGAIAAANALSDVYAMGGRPFLALNLAALPSALPDEMTVAILRGAAEKAKEAGAVIAGGHTIDDDEPKFGLAVLGEVHPQCIGTKAGARAGDLLLLTKPLGVGIIATAAKAGEAEAAHLALAVESMKRLNRVAAEALGGLPLHAVTDVTGFSLLGVSWEVAERSKVQVRVHYSALPFLPGAGQYAEALLFPGASGRNKRSYQAHITFAPFLEYEQQLLALSPETSGGLLISLPPHDAEQYLANIRASGGEAWVIGEVMAGEPQVLVD